MENIGYFRERPFTSIDRNGVGEFMKIGLLKVEVRKDLKVEYVVNMAEIHHP